MTEPNGNPRGYDHASQAGATTLASRLRAYWLNRGFNIKTTVASIQSDERSMVFSVRSSLVCGLPPADSKVLAVEEAAA